MHRSTLAALLAAALLAAGAGSASANPPTPTNPAGPELGVVPVHGQASKHAGGGSNLVYHGGPVMGTNTTHAIYWGPASSFAAGYQTVIDGFLGNVAAASGLSSNVYWSDTQYYGPTGAHITYSSTFGADSILDTDAIPNDCRDSYTPNACVSDTAMQAEIEKVAPASWHGPNSVIFVFTGKNIGSCFGSSTCAFSYYCAYHSNLSDDTAYANMPYAMTVPAACGSGQSPNGNDADSTINVASHEHNESITDPLGSAWFDQRGQEDGDKCAWNFGTALGGATGAKYNQVIGAGHYYLQQEWSNQRSGCVLTGL
ncbi:MAG TPA: hypothetical protein VFT42_11160 [Solirubrobacteraceae bacterium]|nr:hypothetical protein [Solirubrobacteraceae bacterium]